MVLVLVVEDEDFVAALIMEMLTMEGFQVRWAEDGEQALDLVSQDRPDLILLDYMLPGKLTGVGVWRKLHKNPDTATIPVIFVTAYRDGPRRQLANEYVFLLEKPFSRDQLIGMICRILGLEQQRRGEAHGS